MDRWISVVAINPDDLSRHDMDFIEPMHRNKPNITDDIIMTMQSTTKQFA